MIARAGLLPLAVLLMLLTAPAAYAGDQLQVSADGVHWGDQLGQPLFDPAVRWVPGDQRTGSFSVRNQAPDRGRMTIELHAADSDGLLSGGDVVLAARVDNGQWQQLSRSAGRTGLASVPAGRAARVDVRASYLPTATNDTQRASAPLTFQVTLSEARADHDGPGVPTTGELPDTGAPALGPWLGLAAAAIGAGLVLLRRSRTHDQGETHV